MRSLIKSSLSSLLAMVTLCMSSQAHAQYLWPPKYTNEIPGGTTLVHGEGVGSSDGRFLFFLTQMTWVGQDVPGPLVLNQGTSVIWQAGKRGSNGVCHATFQTDGNLVVYGANGSLCTPATATKVMWKSGTNGNPGAVLRVQNDGNVVIYSASGRALWSTKTCCR